MDDWQQALRELPTREGITIMDILALPGPLRAALTKCNRQRTMALPELAAELGLGADAAHEIGALLVDKGYVTIESQSKESEPLYRVRFAQETARTRRRVGGHGMTGIWDALTDE